MPLPAHLLALQRGAGNRAVTSLVQRAGTKKTAAEYNAIVGVSDALLDEGSKLLKSLSRPAVVNDAKADKLSNCALTTLAAIEGGRTSGGTVTKMRQQQGLTTHSTADQSQRVWAMTLEDIDTLAAARLALPPDQQAARTLTSAEEATSQTTTKSLEDFKEGNAYVVGDAQYYGMLKHLAQLAADTSVKGSVDFRVYECGEPGNAMFSEADTLLKMNSFPNGTRFAVFLLSSAKQKVSQHWVYAERFDGQIIFRDFQTNTAGVLNAPPKPVANFLGGFPFSPDPQDAGKSFDKGCFIAFAPFFASAPPQAVPGRQVDLAKAGATLAEVQSKRRGLAPPIEQPGLKLPTNWPGIRQGGALTEIPAPGAVDATLRQLINDFGVTPVCKFGKLDKPGVVKLIGAPTHASTKKQVDVRGPGGQRTTAQVPTDEMTFPNVNAATSVVTPGQPAVQDPAKLSVGGAPQKETSYDTAAAVAYQISAQNTADNIVINSTNAEFTDLIHEATHAFEQATGPMHFKEGLCEIFASIACGRMAAADTAFGRFNFAYNATYAAYTVAMQQLAAVVGLAPLARIYFGPSASFRDSVRAEVLAVAPGAAAQIDTIVDDLVAGEPNDFPARFRQGLSALQTAGTTPQAPSATLTGEYATRETSFGAYMDQQAQAYATRYKVALPGADPVAKGDFVQKFGGIETAENRLRFFYLHRSDVTGGQYVELMKLIGGHEADIGAATGEKPPEIRKRLLPAITVTFKTHYRTEPGEEIYVGGEAPELGAWNTGKAVKLTHRDGGLWSGDVTMPRTGGPVLYKYLLKSGASSTWETPKAGEHHERVMPSNAATWDFFDNWGNVKGL